MILKHFFKVYLFIFAAPGFPCYVHMFFGFREQRLLCGAVHGLLIAVASLVEHVL